MWFDCFDKFEEIVFNIKSLGFLWLSNRSKYKSLAGWIGVGDEEEVEIAEVH
ncbi:hypothetical protein HanHA89_Chr14g0576681 [Helianthus annuus]|nr:hypothetical protein HanHA89_Chr14g0576681 [Helianthus annuus]